MVLTTGADHIRLAADEVSSYNRRGIAYWRKEDFKAAIASFDQAIELSPEWDEPYCNRGMAYMDTDDQARAIADLKKCLELTTDPVVTDPDVRKAAEQALSELGGQ